MPRPRKCRQVCCMPRCERFGPLDQEVHDPSWVLMSVDEYETIRLIDLVGMTQEECAARMQVARTTIQMIYNDARRKLAESLVEGRPLQIGGGNYVLCGDGGEACPKPCCRKNRE